MKDIVIRILMNVRNHKNKSLKNDKMKDITNRILIKLQKSEK